MSASRKVKLVPHKVILVDDIPPCNFCDKAGPYDFKTVTGPWANACWAHYRQYRAYQDLGEGKGQLWVTKDQVTE